MPQTSGVPNTDPLKQGVDYKGWVLADVVNGFGAYLFSGTGPQMAALNALSQVIGLCVVTESSNSRWSELNSPFPSGTRTRINTWLTARGFPTIPGGRSSRQVVEAVYRRINARFEINGMDVAEPFSNALQNLQSGETLVIEDGIYWIDTHTTPLIVGAVGATIRAADGARPVIIDASGTPPRIIVRDGTTISSIWFGGTKDPNNNPITMNSDCVIEDCTFFGYYECIEQGDGRRNVYRRNRFINCGDGGLNHDMYLTSLDTFESPTVIEDHIHVGGEGYKHHFWHGPSNITVRRCFYGGADHVMATDGHGITFQDCIFWSNSVQPPLVFGGDGSETYQAHNNIVGEDTNYFLQFGSPDKVMDRTVFIGNPGVIQSHGTNPVFWEVSDVDAYLGQSKAAIDAAVAALTMAFKADVATIHADATIEMNFDLLAGAVAKWSK